MFESASPAPTSLLVRARRAASSVFALVFAASAYGCAEEGTTSNCPELPLYDLRSDAALDPAIALALAEAADAGCITPPGDATTLPLDAVSDVPIGDKANDGPADAPKDGPSDAPTDSPADAPKDGPADAPRG